MGLSNGARGIFRCGRCRGLTFTAPDGPTAFNGPDVATEAFKVSAVAFQGGLEAVTGATSDAIGVPMRPAGAVKTCVRSTPGAVIAVRTISMGAAMRPACEGP